METGSEPLPVANNHGYVLFSTTDSMLEYQDNSDRWEFARKL